MSKRKRNSNSNGGMGLAMAMLLLVLGAGAGLTIKNAVGEISLGMVTMPSNDCLDNGGGFGFKGLNFDKAAELDEGCAAREAQRMAPDEQRKLFMWCSLPASITAFGSVTNCLGYNGDDQRIIAEVRSRMDYCEHKSEKWYRKVTFQRNRSYNRCMGKWRG
jgi:hypothetical protein